MLLQTQQWLTLLMHDTVIALTLAHEWLNDHSARFRESTTTHRGGCTSAQRELRSKGDLMTKRTRRSVLCPWLAACVLIAISALPAAAQSAKGDSPLVPGSFGAVVDRSTTYESQGLNNPDLRLSPAQKAEIDKLVNDYVGERRRLLEKFPVVPQQMPTAEAIIARQAAHVAFTTALGKVMDAEQHKIWKSAQAARIPPRDPDGFRPSSR